MAYKPNIQSDLRPLTVEQLVHHLREASREDSSVFCEELIRRFEPLLRSAWRRGAFEAEYKDFAQDVFVRLFQGLPQLQNLKAFPGYFRSVALSVAADHSRKQVLPFVSKWKLKLRVSNPVEEQIVTGIFIRSYIEHLPPREREIITLEYLQDCSVPDIAKQLGITQGAVRTAKARAFSRLRSILLHDAKSLEENLKN